MKAPFRLTGDFVIPHYLLDGDLVWLGALVDEYRRYCGRRRRELSERLRTPLPAAAPESKLRLAIQVLDRIWKDSCRTRVSPRKLRSAVFREAATGGNRKAVLRSVTASFGLTPDELEETLFADIPEERRLLAPASEPSLHELALQINLALLQRLLNRASEVRVRLLGNARAVVRHAKLRGLLCEVRSASARGSGGPGVLQMSGPYAIFRHTRIYGRALSSLLPVLKRCNRFELRARCHLAGGSGILIVRSADPIPSAIPGRSFDSKVEECFARDFVRLALEWDILREPEPVTAGQSIIFPDFALTHRRLKQRWLLEIIGFWTPDYLLKKLAALRESALSNIILCIDVTLNCSDAEFPPAAQIVRYRRRIDPAAVVRIIESDGPT